MTPAELRQWCEAAQPGDVVQYDSRDYRGPLPEQTPTMIEAMTLYAEGKVALFAKPDDDEQVTFTLYGVQRLFNLTCMRITPLLAERMGRRK
jgi:hypothetical protein